jgi:hypothetical protein
MSEQNVAHTPTPWRLEIEGDERMVVSSAIDKDGDRVLVCDLYRGGYDYSDLGYSMDANAAFIVRAVNSHDELVAALEGICAGEIDASGTAIILGNDAWTKLSNAMHALSRARGEGE